MYLEVVRVLVFDTIGLVRLTRELVSVLSRDPTMVPSKNSISQHSRRSSVKLKMDCIVLMHAYAVQRHRATVPRDA